MATKSGCNQDPPVTPTLLALGDALGPDGKRLDLFEVGDLSIELRAGSDALWAVRSEEHTSELQSLMRISYAVFGLKTKTHENNSYSNNTAQDISRDNKRTHDAPVSS